MKLTVHKAFDWAHRGVEIEHFEAGREIDTEDPETDQEMVEVAQREGWFEEPDEQKATKGASKAK